MLCLDCGKDNLPGDDHCAGCGHDLPAPPSRRPDDELAGRMRKGKVLDLKPRPAVSVAPDAPVADAVRLMREEKVGAILVVKAGKVVGIMTERDVLYEVAGSRDPQAVNVVDVMHVNPDFLGADEPISYAFHHMSVGGYRHMPVELPDGNVGMVSSRDLLAYLADSK
ncbi:CBS domain-containing protein [bacterium]|nr:MAG: CBS domain-containing protein [bacterium]